LLHHAVACRILRRHLECRGDASVAPAASDDAGAGVDITCARGGAPLAVKVKSDMYFGDDAAKIGDRDLIFYRRRGDDYAFESISHHLTRQPGWIFRSDADQLYYYFLAIAQPEEEVRALMGEQDDVFFSELAVECDSLHVIAMPPLREWFEANYESYAPRPVLVGDHSAWYRIVSQRMLAAAVPITVVGPVFAQAAGR
jgi:hypothetical protein